MTIALSEVRRLRAAIRVLERELGLDLQSQTACCGVTPPQCHVLLELDRRGPLTASDLAEAMGLDKSTLSRTLSGLTEAGQVVRSEDPADRRALRVSLTARGRRTVQSIDGECDGSYRALLLRLPEERRQDVLEAAELLGVAMRASRGRRSASASPRAGVELRAAQVRRR
jgi:DNA-binding MarR family transcriptional regulator